MIKINGIGLRIIITLILLAGLLYLPAPAFSQEITGLQNLIRNGGFEQGFEGDFGVGYEWGGFSNGNATVGWSADSWSAVVPAGKNAQLIEINNSAERDRYAGIYQTVRVVPGQQYKLTLKGLIRSTEGNIEKSDYGYRLQYAIDYNGATAWELVSSDEWNEIPWDEQRLETSADNGYRIDTYSATVTAKSDKLTLFVRGWKKWINNGSGLYNLDEISLVGPAPDGFEAPVAQAASVGNSAPQPDDNAMNADASIVQGSETTAEEPDAAAQAADDNAGDIPDESAGTTATESNNSAAPQVDAPLPVSGHGQDDSINYVLIVSLVLLLVLLAAAVTATKNWRRHSIE